MGISSGSGNFLSKCIFEIPYRRFTEPESAIPNHTVYVLSAQKGGGGGGGGGGRGAV